MPHPYRGRAIFIGVIVALVLLALAWIIWGGNGETPRGVAPDALEKGEGVGRHRGPGPPG